MKINQPMLKQEIFYFLSATAALFICLEIFWPRIILAYFNLNWLFLLWLISALWALAKD